MVILILILLAAAAIAAVIAINFVPICIGILVACVLYMYLVYPVICKIRKFLH